MGERNLIQILNELDDYIAASETPREAVLMSLGFLVGIAFRTGWSVSELVALRLWPKPDPNSDDEKRTIGGRSG